MTEIKTLSVKCPTCSKPVVMNASSPYRPFCSERCKAIDFGDWATETHKIEGDKINNDEHWSDDAPKN